MTVSVVEDHMGMCDLYEHILGSHPDIELISTSHHFRDFQLSLKSRQPDVAILDIWLDDVSGIEIAEWLIRAYPLIKIIFISAMGYNDREFVRLKKLCRGYLRKPFPPETVLEAIISVFHGDTWFKTHPHRFGIVDLLPPDPTLDE